jgi:predicted transcriptional regulator
MSTNYYSQNILECLNKNEFGLSITEIAKKIEGNRNTVSKYLKQLEKKDLVYKKEIGKACLYFIKDIQSKLLNFVAEHPSGVSMREIYHDLKVPRESVRKYVNILENQNKIYSKKVGGYTLYFSSERNFIPMKFMISFEKALFQEIVDLLKKIKPNTAQIFKEIGRNMFENIDFPISKRVLKIMDDFKTSPIKKLHFEVFKDIFPSYYLFGFIEISEPKINKSGKKAIYRFKNSEFLTNSDAIYHFNLMSGMIETKMSKDLGVPIMCNVEEIYISKIKEDSYAEISIEIT